MSERPLPLVFEPALVEEVVLRRVSGTTEERPFRRAREKAYAIADADEREAAFTSVHREWFQRLDLDRPIRTALAELPILARTCNRSVVGRAPTRRDEGADLLVAATVDGEPDRTVAIRLRPCAFEDADGMVALLRRELLHVADMVDPAFAYEPSLPEGDAGPTYANILRNRYSALWNATVAGRLRRLGRAAEDARASARRDFAASFPMLAGEEEAFERFFSMDAPAHAELVAYAMEPRTAAAGERLVPGGRCPLCRFPTHTPEPRPEAMPETTQRRISLDFPSWRPFHGLCRQCADLYRAREISAVAAAQLPGLR